MIADAGEEETHPLEDSRFGARARPQGRKRWKLEVGESFRKWVGCG